MYSFIHKTAHIPAEISRDRRALVSRLSARVVPIISLLFISGCIQSPESDFTESELSRAVRGESGGDEASMSPLDSMDPEDHSGPLMDEERRSAPEVPSDVEAHRNEPLPEDEVSVDDASPLSICAPEPTVWRTKWTFARALRSWVLDADNAPCALDQGEAVLAERDALRARAYFGERGTTQCDADGCWRTSPSFVKTWREVADPDQGPISSGTQWTGVVDARVNLDNGTLHAIITAVRIGSTAVQQIERKWTERGHLTLERHAFNHQPWSVIRYTWAGGRLLHIDIQDLINGRGRRNFEFSYDLQGRLSTSTVTIQEKRHQALSVWTYDDLDRPVSVERQWIAEGEAPTVWLKQNWRYDEQGALAHRSSSLDFQHLQEATWILERIDNYMPRVNESQRDWDLTSYRFDEQKGCQQLPVSIEHGYPSGDRRYALGWGIHDRPAHIDQAHGYERIYRVGDLGWFGHLGPQGGLSFNSTYLHVGENIGQDQTLQVEDGAGQYYLSTEYREGRPLRELIFSRDTGLESDPRGELISQRRFTWHRGLLVRDAIEFNDGIIRALNFTYNDDLLRIRTLTFGDELIARHTWTEHPDSRHLPEFCRIARYDIEYNVDEMTALSRGSVNQVDVNDVGHERSRQTFDTHYTYTTSLEGQCDRLSMSGPFNAEISLDFNERGQLIKQTGELTLNRFQYRNIRLTYDETQQKISRIERLDASGDAEYLIVGYRFDERGQLTARMRDNHETLITDLFTYTCD